MASSKYKSVLTNGFLIFAALLLLAGTGTTQTTALSAATREYKRLVNLKTALRKMPTDKQDKEPQRSFLKRNEKDIVYSDPAGEWYVRSKRFWDLQKKYHKLALADKIAWTAAENPLPGECEGYVNCYLFNIQNTYGRYLTLYPKGAFSRKAVQNTITFLGYIVDDTASTKKNYDGPTESPDRADFIKMIKELRDILTKISHPESAKALSQLKQIEKAF